MYEENLHLSIFRYFVRMTSSVSLLRKWTISGLIAFFAAILGLLPAVSASAVGNLDQQATGTSANWYYSMNGGYVVGQQFTAGASGTLDRITIDMLISNGTPGAVSADLYASDSNGFPTGSVLASTTTPEASVTGTASTVAFDFGTPAPITSGSSYVVVFGNTGNGGYHYMNATVIPAGAKAVKRSGPSAAWQNHIDPQISGEYSFRFATYVTPVASPSSSSSSTPDPSLVHTGLNEVQSYQFLGLGAVLLLAGAVVINIARVRSRQN